MAAIVIFFIAHWYLSLFTQTVLNHRYAAHGAFTMSKFWERAFFIFAYVAQGASYLSPRAYAIMHRMHHAYTDTEQDPHSPKYDRNIFTMMKRTADIYNKIYHRTMDVEDRFLKNVPDWPGFDRLAVSWVSRLMWVGIYLAFYLVFAPSLWWCLLLPIHILMGPVHGAIINWFAHKYGYVNFKLDNTSHNLLPVDVLMLGEAYHNNHHKFPSSINFGVRWFEIDPVYPVLVLLDWLGIIHFKHVTTKPKLIAKASRRKAAAHMPRKHIA
jgi:stearoyl-CoA desaturase (Delta-9 desaturase)